MKLGPITREEALKIDAKYVAFAENGLGSGEFDYVFDIWQKLKRGQFVLTVSHSGVKEKTFIIAKVTKVDRNCFQAIDGPVVRVADDTGSWRCDGCGYCVPVSR